MTLSDPRRNDIIDYRIEKSSQTLKEAKDVARLGYWSLAANRLYYAAYYASVALLIKNGITANTHKGAVRMICFKFVNEGILPTSDAQLLGRLFSMRQSGDYDDLFDWTKEDIEPLIPMVEEYIQRILRIIGQ